MILVLALVELLLSVVFIVMAVLSRLERLPRNQWFGYRLPLLLEDDDAWRAGHRAAWIPTLLCAVALIVGAIGTIVERREEAIPWWSLGGCLALGVLAIIGSACALVGANRAVGRR